MKIAPQEEYINRAERNEALKNKVTRVLALLLVTASTFAFFFKLLFM